MTLCETCIWYRDREYTEEEKAFLKANPNVVIKHKVCSLGGCDGALYIKEKTIWDSKRPKK